MTTLGEFHSLVRAEANKGSRLDAVIPGAVRKAARWLERNYSFSYMDRYVQFSLDPASEDSRVAPIDSSVKSINFIKRLEHNGTRFVDIARVSAQDTDKVIEGPPTQYWLDGHQWVWFNKVPTEVYTFHMSYVAYTNWPTSLTAEHWLLDSGEDVLLAKTMGLMGPGQREDWESVYAGMFADGLPGMLSSDTELKYRNVRAFMQYKPDFVDDPRLG